VLARSLDDPGVFARMLARIERDLLSPETHDRPN